MLLSKEGECWLRTRARSISTLELAQNPNIWNTQKESIYSFSEQAQIPIGGTLPKCFETLKYNVCVIQRMCRSQLLYVLFTFPLAGHKPFNIQPMQLNSGMWWPNLGCEGFPLLDITGDFKAHQSQEQPRLLNSSLHACSSLAEMGLCGHEVNPWNHFRVCYSFTLACPSSPLPGHFQSSGP